ncbi:MAG: PHP domain-containing protein [Streptosporangiaceae bacterium]
MRADLHCHSSVSDGTDPPAAVIRRAQEAGLDVVALTDHDTAAGHEEAARALPPGLTLLPGMELSCRLDGRSVHILAYLVNPQHAELAAQCAAIRDSRVHRARAMVARLAELGAPVTWEQVTAIADGGVVGRPHVARALADAGVVGCAAEAFGPEWIGSGGRAHVARYALDPVAAIALIRAAGGVSVLAHPRGEARGAALGDDTIAALAAAGLTGVEVDHPQHDRATREQLGRLAAGLGLVATGGSDDHGALTGYRIGAETTGEAGYARLVSQATGARPLTAAAGGR